MRYQILFTFFFFSFSSLISQTNVGLKTVQIDEEGLINNERIESIAFLILNSKSDKKKDSLNIILKELLLNELSKEVAFQHDFSSVKSISILTPRDSSFRLFNWNIPYSNGTFHYECGFLKRDLKPYFFISNQTTNQEKDLKEPNKWTPALYYNIVEKETDFTTYYTLLAWKGNDRLTTQKVIDVLWLDQKGDLRFGAPIFKLKNETKSKIVFEYAAQNIMSLNYNDKLDRIQFDHLSPPKQSLTGIYEYYGPDLSYDAFYWEKHQWVLREDVDLDEGLKKRKSDFKVDKESILKEEPIYDPKQ